MWSFVILDAWQSVEACRRVREAPYPVLTTQTPTPVPVAVLGCWRLQPVTLSRFVCFFNESETVVAPSPQKKPPSTCSSPVLPAEVTVKRTFCVSYCSSPSASSTWSLTLSAAGTPSPSSMEAPQAPPSLASTVAPPPPAPSNQGPTSWPSFSWPITASPKEASSPLGRPTPPVG